MEGDINQGVTLYKKALYYNWHYADAMYNLGVAYGEMLKFDMVCLGQACLYFTHTLHVFYYDNHTCILVCTNYIGRNSIYYLGHCIL